jgi:hypothetical protein
VAFLPYCTLSIYVYYKYFLTAYTSVRSSSSAPSLVQYNIILIALPQQRGAARPAIESKEANQATMAMIRMKQLSPSRLCQPRVLFTLTVSLLILLIIIIVVIHAEEQVRVEILQPVQGPPVSRKHKKYRSMMTLHIEDAGGAKLPRDGPHEKKMAPSKTSHSNSYQVSMQSRGSRWGS